MIYARSVNFAFILDMSEVLENIYIWVFSAAVLKIMFFYTFWRLKALVLWRKMVQNLLIFVYLFCSKNNAIDSRKTSITQERLVVESFPTPRWITFLMPYRMVYNICTAENMREYRFLLTRILPYKFRIIDSVLIRENTSQLKPVFSYILRSDALISMN